MTNWYNEFWEEVFKESLLELKKEGVVKKTATSLDLRNILQNYYSHLNKLINTWFFPGVVFPGIGEMFVEERRVVSIINGAVKGTYFYGCNKRSLRIYITRMYEGCLRTKLKRYSKLGIDYGKEQRIGRGEAEILDRICKDWTGVDGKRVIDFGKLDLELRTGLRKCKLLFKP